MQIQTATCLNPVLIAQLIHLPYFLQQCNLLLTLFLMLLHFDFEVLILQIALNCRQPFDLILLKFLESRYRIIDSLLQ